MKVIFSKIYYENYLFIFLLHESRSDSLLFEISSTKLLFMYMYNVVEYIIMLVTKLKMNLKRLPNGECNCVHISLFII